MVTGGNGEVGLPVAMRATECALNDACLPATSRVCNSIEMTQLSAAAAAVNHTSQFYIDTKGAGGDSGSVSHNVEHGTSSEAGPRTPTSLFATDSRSTYARVADNCSLPPEVEQLRRGGVTSVPSSSDEHCTAGKFV